MFRCRESEFDDKSGSAIAQHQPYAMEIRDGGDQCQPKPAAWRGSTAVQAHKASQYVIACLNGNAWPGIADASDDAVGRRKQVELDTGAGRRVMKGVLDQV